jgi:tetratricopeptide (TPR) repeat protein
LRLKKVLAKIDAVVAGKSFFLLLGIILFCGLLFRVAYIEADPPVGITKSQDFSTDPFQYVYFAKNSVDHGVANPYHDPRFAQWEKSSENFLALVVFNILGTGRAEGNSVAIIFNLASILLLALALKNFGSRLAALLFAALASFDFTMIWFGRTPFLEGAQNFWICLSVFFFSLGPTRFLYYILAGIACAAAAFFGKMTALFMAGVFLVAWLLLYLNDNESRRATLKNALFFAGGFAFSTLAYLVLVYLPSRSQVSGYLSEQAFGLYGAPKALDSPNSFCYQLFTLLWDTQFFTKMPIVTVLAFIGGAGILTWLAVKPKDKKFVGDFNVGWLLILLWFGAGYVALFPWNYRPLRYQTTVMFPAFALAAIALAYIVEYGRLQRVAGKKVVERVFNLPVLLTAWGLWLLPLLALIVLSLVVSASTGTTQTFIGEQPFVAALLFLVLGALLALGYKSLGSGLRKFHSAAVVVAGLLVVLALGWGVKSFLSWSGERQYSLITADRDLGAILGKDAVVSGSYATAFTQENGLGCIIHMFGVVNVDTAFFEKYPITHIAIDDGNEKFAREQYPNLMKGASFVTRYYPRGFPVKIFRVAEVSPNPEARHYQPTDYERAQLAVVAGQSDSAEFYMRSFLNSGVPNYTANLYVGDALNSSGNLERAIESYRKAQEFSPRDAVSAVGMGNCFLALGAKQTTPAYFDSALVYFKMARSLYKGDARLTDMITQLERRK